MVCGELQPEAAASADDFVRQGDVAHLARRLELAGARLVAPGAPRCARYVVVDGGDGSRDYWARLHNWCRKHGASTAFADYVMPQCPLLSAERAPTVLGPIGLQAPLRTAWITMTVDLSRFAKPSAGTIDDDTLANTLRTCVDVGDVLHDSVRWSTSERRHDSWLNRRLAISITGIGDAAVSLGLDPGDLATLRFLAQVVLSVRMTLQSRSRELAASVGQLPAIALSDPSDALPCGGVRDDWQRRWRSAASASMVRHRNLLVLSPWALFPSGPEAGFRYAELLPLLRHADACAFAGGASLTHWKLNEFRRFHERARAVLVQRGTGSLIAEQL